MSKIHPYYKWRTVRPCGRKQIKPSLHGLIVLMNENRCKLLFDSGLVKRNSFSMTGCFEMSSCLGIMGWTSKRRLRRFINFTKCDHAD